MVPVRDNVPWENGVWWWEVNSLAASLAHELGHSLDLHHECNHYIVNGCAHALMNQAGHNGDHLHNYIPPTEIGKIHYTLSTTRIKDFVSKKLQSIAVFNISSNLLWDNDFRSFANIAIKEKGSVVANKGIQMPIKSHIEVCGQLYLQGGNARCVSEDARWEGIRVKNGGVLWLENTTISDYDIFMETGSTLIMSGEITVENQHKIVLDEGCYVCTNATFITQSGHKPFSYVSAPIRGIKPDLNLLRNPGCTIAGLSRFRNAAEKLVDTVYVQNIQITNNTTYVGKRILVGSHVTTTKQAGQVVIKKGAKVSFITHNGGTCFFEGFRCEEGGDFRTIDYRK